MEKSPKYDANPKKYVFYTGVIWPCSFTPFAQKSVQKSHKIYGEISQIWRKSQEICLFYWGVFGRAFGPAGWRKLTPSSEIAVGSAKRRPNKKILILEKNDFFIS